MDGSPPLELSWWTRHGLDKIFPDSMTPPRGRQRIDLAAARNETEDAQVGIRVPRGVEIDEAGFEFSDLQGPGGATIDRSQLRGHWQWFTYVLNNPPSNTDPASYLRKAPAFFPDAFLEQSTIQIRDEWTQPLWISVAVPSGARAGDYTGRVTIKVRAKDDRPATIEVPIALRVWPFALPVEPTLHHTEWFFPEQVAEYYRIEPWSEAHWQWIAKAAADMKAHRQDMILTNFFALVETVRVAGGGYRFDFTRLDRWIETFMKAGLTWIEGGHVAGRVGGWESAIAFNTLKVHNEAGEPISGPADAAENEQAIKALLTATHAHLRERGWAERYAQHVADEPIPFNAESWRYCAAKVRQWVPGVPIIDAAENKGLSDLLDWPVPQIQSLVPEGATQTQQLWMYVCLFPQGQYPNRFLDYPSIRNRIMFWLCWTQNCRGFLHWGYNHWSRWGKVPVPVDVSPWLDATGASIYVADRQPLPAGDPFIVYPGRSKICSSIRWEVVRKGMEDYEYLRLLEAAIAAPGANAAAVAEGKALLDEVRKEIAPDPINHIRDDDALLDIRRRIGETLGKLLGASE